MTKIFVFDTNCLISAHLLSSSINRKAYDKAFEQGTLVCSEETLYEFESTFMRSKFDKYIDVDKRKIAIREFKRRSLIIPITQTVQICRDPKDDKFLSLALSAYADCIITGDNDLLVLNPFLGVSILNSTNFLTRY